MEKRLYMLWLTLCLYFIGAGAFNLLCAQQSASRPIYRTESAVSGYRSVTGIYSLFIKKSQFFFESTGLHGGNASFRYSSGKTPHVVRFSGEGPYRCLENAICAGNVCTPERRRPLYQLTPAAFRRCLSSYLSTIHARPWSCRVRLYCRFLLPGLKHRS